jgi:hypothetical protein
LAIPLQVTFDCADPARVASFWAEALGYKLQDPPEGYASWPDFLTAIGIPETDWNKASAIVDPDGRGPRIYFQRVPESKVVKNRVHLDVNVGGGPGTSMAERRARVHAAVERLCGIDASKLRSYEE